MERIVPQSLEFTEEEDFDESEGTPPREFEEATAHVTTNAISAVFGVHRPVTIPSDGNDHKVTIAILDFQLKKYYETIPSKSTDAFLVASIINDSESPLLPGAAAIYVDNNFIAKTTINSVSPGEHFTCCLGADPAIKVTYKPIHKFSEQAGLLVKYASVTHERSIVIKNTRTSAIQITVRENVPKSTDEKIRIKLLSPELDKKRMDTKTTEPTLGTRLDDDHNLEWTVNIEPNCEKELLLKWSAEYPNDQTVSFKESFPNRSY